MMTDSDDPSVKQPRLVATSEPTPSPADCPACGGKSRNNMLSGSDEPPAKPRLLGTYEHTPGHIDCPACGKLRNDMLFSGHISAAHRFDRAAELWLDSLDLADKVPVARDRAPKNRRRPDQAQFIAPRTLKDYRQYVQALGKFFDRLRLDQIHPGHMRQYQIERNRTAGATKINQELGIVKRLLMEAGLWTAEFEDCYHPLQVPFSDVPRAMSPEEQTFFLQVAASREEWQLVHWYCLLALETTANNCEMRGLRVGDVNFFERVMQVRAHYAKNRFRVRTIPLNDDALWAVDRIRDRARALGSMDPAHYLFPFCVHRSLWDPTRPMSESGIKRDFEDVRAAAGVPWLRGHDLRHCAITRLAEEGVPIPVIMSIAGHISLRMLQHYTQISEQAKRKAVERPHAPHGVKSVRTLHPVQSLGWSRGKW